MFHFSSLPCAVVVALLLQLLLHVRVHAFAPLIARPPASSSAATRHSFFSNPDIVSVQHCNAVASAQQQQRRSQQPLMLRVPPLSMVDPITFAANVVMDMDITMEIGVAMVSAAAGAFSQVPRIQALERELQTTKDALTVSEADLVEKIHVLEEKLFVMDQEFEEQTVRFQRQYDRTQREQIEGFKQKLKTEMQFKLEIQLAQERSAKLMEQAVSEHGRTTKQEELSQLKLKQARLADLNMQLEQTLETTEQELNKMRTQASTKRFRLW